LITKDILMEVNTKETDSIPIIAVIGDISMYDIQALSDTINITLAKGKNNIIMNLKDTPFIDSSGIGLLLSTIVKLAKTKGVVYFTDCNQTVNNLLLFSVKNTSSKIFNSEEEAIKDIKQISAEQKTL
jgi:anti-anti-sigma factor